LLAVGVIVGVVAAGCSKSTDTPPPVVGGLFTAKLVVVQRCDNLGAQAFVIRVTNEGPGKATGKLTARVVDATGKDVPNTREITVGTTPVLDARGYVDYPVPVPLNERRVVTVTDQRLNQTSGAIPLRNGCHNQVKEVGGFTVVLSDQHCSDRVDHRQVSVTNHNLVPIFIEAHAGGGPQAEPLRVKPNETVELPVNLESVPGRETAVVVVVHPLNAGADPPTGKFKLKPCK
jgi:hypothetical protein